MTRSVRFAIVVVAAFASMSIAAYAAAPIHPLVLEQTANGHTTEFLVVLCRPG